jgi:hypothetical protein
MPITNPHINSSALQVLNAFLATVRPGSPRQRIESILSLKPKRWGNLKPDIFWQLGWSSEWSKWPDGAEGQLSPHLDSTAWLFSVWLSDPPSQQPLGDILQNESGCLVIVPQTVHLVLNDDGGMAIHWQ